MAYVYRDKRLPSMWMATKGGHELRASLVEYFDTQEAAEAYAKHIEEQFPGRPLGDGRRISPKQWDRYCELAHENSLFNQQKAVKHVADDFNLPLRTFQRKLSQWRQRNGIETVFMKKRREYIESKR